MRISDWSSDVCSSDLPLSASRGCGGCKKSPPLPGSPLAPYRPHRRRPYRSRTHDRMDRPIRHRECRNERSGSCLNLSPGRQGCGAAMLRIEPAIQIHTSRTGRSEEHTYELQVTNAHLVCRLLLEKKKTKMKEIIT